MTNETALTVAAAILGSTYFLYCKLLKTAKLSLPNGLSVDKQAVEVKGQPGVWKSALMENESEDVLTRFYPEVATLHDVFVKGKTESNGGPCVGTRSSGDADYEFLTYDDVHEQAKNLSMTLVHEFGLTPANTTNIGIYARNSPQWLVSAVACVEQSMVVVPLYDTLGAEAATFIISQAEISVVIVDSFKKAESLIKNRENMPTLKNIIVIDSADELKDGTAIIDTIRVESLTNALNLGSRYPFTNNLPKPDDNYIICYTSGTTGTPKGVMLTHSNIVANISGFLKILFAFQPSMIDATQVHISYLPLSHMMEQLTHWTLLGFGSKIGYFRGSIQGLTDDIKTLKPTVFPVVPRLLNRLYDAITSKVQQQGFMAKLVYNFAFARKLSLVKAGKVGRDTIWDRLVFNKIQQQIGGKVDLMVTGSAPISSTVLETCRVTLGTTIVEGYGQTECTALATFTWMGDPSTGHCGAPAPCALVKLGDVPDLNYFAKDGKGEIRIKGPCVTKGYYKDPERTAELFDEEGFLQTGDIGEMLPNGTIRIIDRKKHIFKLAQGEYVAPEKIEQVYIRTKTKAGQRTEALFMPSSNNSSNGASSSSPIASKYSSGRMRRMSCCQLVISAVLIGLGSFLLFGSLITHTVVVPKVVKSSIEENSRLVNGSIMWEKWAMPEYKIRFNMYVYSTKNPDEFMNGAIPEVTGSGPYVFDKKMENRVVSAENGTVKYRRFFTYNFNEQESCQTCILGNRIWVPNMIYQKFVEAASTEGMKAAATTLLSQTAFLEVEVEELLFEGYKDPFLDKVCEIPFMNFVCEAILDVPERIGLFFKANGTGSKVYEIDDGTRNPDDLGKILSYDESPILDETWWSTDESLKIKGTDGSLFHPFLSKHEKLYVYVAELCRSIWLEFKEEVEYRGLKAYRFVVPPEVFDVTHPGNQGFCNPSEKQFYESQNDSSNCMPKGLLEISKCQQSQPPITISLPNFLFAPSEVRGSVKGLNETDEIRDSIVVDIEPRVGAVLYARRVSQVNIEMWKGKNLTFPVNLKKMKSALIPVLILHETSEIDDDSLEQIRSQLYETESIAYTSCDVMMIIGAIMLLLGFLFLSFSLGLCDPILGRRSKRANGLSPEPLPPYVPKGEPNGYHHNHAYM